MNPSSRLPAPSELAHLRPSTGLELTDRVLALLRSRLSVFLGLGSLGGLLAIEAELVQQREGSGWALAGLALGLAAKWPLAAALTVAFQALLFPRRPLGAWAALRGVAARMPHLLLTLLVSDAVLALMVLATANLLQSPGGGWSLDPVNWGLAGAMTVLALYLAALWALVPAVVLLEGRAMFDALGRSAELMRQRFALRLFGDSAIRRLILLMLVAVAVAVAGQVLLPVVRWVALGMPPVGLAGSSLPLPSEAVWENSNLAIAAILSCVLWPYIQTVVAVLYAECRMRREGLDLQTRLLSREVPGREVSGHPEGLESSG